MHQKLKATPGIYLVGYMGCGKSRVGRLLAEREGWGFVDLDAESEQAAGKSIAAIFADDGEERFRDLEFEALERQTGLIRAGGARVVALGGGAFAFERNRERVDECGVSIWLEVPVEKLWSRVAEESHRPLAKSRAAFESRYAEREPLYKRADFRIQADTAPETAVERILALKLL